MYRIKLATGHETEVNSFEELAFAVTSGIVTSEAHIFHQRAEKWLPITDHPHYRRAVAEVPPSNGAAPVAPSSVAEDSRTESAVEIEASPPAPARQPEEAGLDLMTLLDLDDLDRVSEASNDEQHTSNDSADPPAEHEDDLGLITEAELEVAPELAASSEDLEAVEADAPPAGFVPEEESYGYNVDLDEVDSHQDTTVPQEPASQDDGPTISLDQSDSLGTSEEVADEVESTDQTVSEVPEEVDEPLADASDDLDALALLPSRDVDGGDELFDQSADDFRLDFPQAMDLQVETGTADDHPDDEPDEDQQNDPVAEVAAAEEESPAPEPQAEEVVEPPAVSATTPVDESHSERHGIDSPDQEPQEDLVESDPIADFQPDLPESGVAGQLDGSRGLPLKLAGIAAGILVVAIAGWLLTGLLGGGEASADPSDGMAPASQSQTGTAGNPSASDVAAYQEAYDRTVDQLAADFEEADVSQLFASRRFSTRSELSRAAASIGSATEAVLRFRQAEAALEASRPQGAPSLSESRISSEMAEDILSVADRVYRLLLGNLQSFAVRNRAMTFTDSEAEARYIQLSLEVNRLMALAGDADDDPNARSLQLVTAAVGSTRPLPLSQLAPPPAIPDPASTSVAAPRP